MASLQARSFALEGSFFRSEEQQATARHLERLVEAGKLPQSALTDAASSSTSFHQYGSYNGVPTTVRGKPEGEVVYHHVKGLFPALKPSMMDSWKLGTQVSFGRARWEADNVSIFSVNDGKALAQTPVKAISHYDQLRMQKILTAAEQSPTIAGYRVLPRFTPGRAFLWGSILALWGTTGAVMATAKSMGIHETSDAPDVLRQIITPYVDFFKSHLSPLKGLLEATDRGHNEIPELAKQLKTRFQHQA